MPPRVGDRNGPSGMGAGTATVFAVFPLLLPPGRALPGPIAGRSVFFQQSQTCLILSYNLLSLCLSQFKVRFSLDAIAHAG